MNQRRNHCDEVLEKLPLYLGADLDADVLGEVKAHLDSCASCSLRAAEGLRARHLLVSSYRSYVEESPAPELWAGIREVLRAEGRISDPGSGHGPAEATGPVTRRPQPVHAALPAGPGLSSAPSRTGRRPWGRRLALVVGPLAAAAALIALLQLGANTPDGAPGALAPGRGPVASPLSPVVSLQESAAPSRLQEASYTGGLRHAPATSGGFQPAQPFTFGRHLTGSDAGLVEPGGGGVSLAGYR